MTRINHLISLKDVLRSTQIEFLQFETPLLQIADTLGPPKGWITHVYDGQLVPLYWVYPGGLELSFDPEPPYRLSKYKLSDVGAHKGKVTKFSYYVRMRNDFPMIETTVSGLLRSGFWCVDDVRVGICKDPRSPALDICIQSLRIPFLMSWDKEVALEEPLANSGDNLQSRVALLDRNCDFHGAYFSPEEPEKDRVSGSE